MNDFSSPQTELAADFPERIQQETQGVFLCLAEEFDKQLQFAENELTQTQGLLKDAVDTLTACFSGIHEKLCKPPGADAASLLTGDGNQPQESSKSHDGSPGPENEGMAGLSDSELEFLLNTAIRTLQFQDLTKQLIDHALHRVAAMRVVMNDIKSVSEGQYRMSFAELLNHHRASIEHNVANIDEHKTNPVSQGHMMTGEIELF